MARTRDLAPYPSPSPTLYDEQLPQLRDVDLRDGYDKQFRINQRLRRWGIEIADIINALDIGGWDPSTRVVFVGDGEDADYTTVDEAVVSVSASSYLPIIVVVFPGTYFSPMYVPAHTYLYGIGPRGSVKIKAELENGMTVVQLNKGCKMWNIDVEQSNASATGTTVVKCAGVDIELSHVKFENKATDENSKVLNIDDYTGTGIFRGHDIHLKGVTDAGDVGDLGAQELSTLEGNEYAAYLADDIAVHGVSWKFVPTPADAAKEQYGDSYCTRVTDSPGAWATYSINMYSFGDTTDHLGTSQVPNNIDAITYEGYHKVYTSFPYTKNMIAFTYNGGKGWLLYAKTTGELCLAIYSAYETQAELLETGWNMELNVWYLLGVFYDSVAGEMKVYVDGLLKGSTSCSTKPFGTSGAATTLYPGVGSTDNNLEAGPACAGNLRTGDHRYWFGGYESTIQHVDWFNQSSTLEIGREATGTLTDVDIDGLVMENDKPCYNLYLGDVPFRIHQVTSVLSADNVNSHVKVDNNKDNQTEYLMNNAAFLGAYNGDIFTYGTDGPRIELTPSFHASMAATEIDNIKYNQAAIPVGPVVVDDVFQLHADGEAHNLLYIGEVSHGHVMPQAVWKWFINLHADKLMTADDHVARIGHWRRKPTLELTGTAGTAPSSWDIVDEDWEDITDWTSESLGTSLIEESPSGELHLKCGDAGGTDSTAGKYQDSLTTGVSLWTCEMRIKFDQIANFGVDTDGMRVDIGNGTNRFYINIFADKIRYFDGASNKDFATDAITTGTWYVYRFVMDSSGGTSAKVYRDDDLKGTKTDMFPSAVNDGRVRLICLNYSGTPTETEIHMDYVKVVTGDYGVYTSEGSAEKSYDAEIREDPYDWDAAGYPMPEPPIKNFMDVHIENLAKCRSIQSLEIFSDGLGSAGRFDVDPHPLIYPTEIKGIYQDRGNEGAGAWDFTLGDFTTDGAWHTLDLSSIVPKGAILISARLSVQDNIADQFVTFRNPSDDNTQNMASSRTNVANAVVELPIIISCDAEKRIVAYQTSNTVFTAINFFVRGWWL